MKKFILLFLALTTFSQLSFAIMESETIDLRAAIDKALTTNPQLQMLDMDIEISKNSIKSVNRLQNPSLDINQNIGEIRHGNSQQIGASYLVEVLKRGKRKNVAKNEETIAVNKRLFSQYNLILEVRKAYIDLLLKKSNFNIVSEQKKIAQDLFENMQKDAKTGKIPQTEAVQAKISLNRTVMAERKAKYAVFIAQNKFNTIMNTSDVNYDTRENGLGVNYEELMTISPLNDTLLNYEKIKTFALNKRYDLAKAKKEIEKAENELKVVKSKLLPDIELSGGYGYETKAQSETGEYLHGSYVMASLVNLPVFYQYKPEIESAKIKIEKAKLNYQDIEIDAIRDITDAWEKFIKTRETLNFYNSELLPNSKELMNTSVTLLKDKKINFVEFLVSKKTYFDLMLGYEQALADYYISYAELLTQMNIIEVEKENI